MKIKIVLDCNTFDKLIELQTADINLITEKCLMLSCNTLSKEIDKTRISNSKKHEKMTKIFEGLDKKNCGLFGFIDWNDDSNSITNNIAPLYDWNSPNHNNAELISFDDYEVYKNIHPNATNHKKEKDRQIALVASAHDCDILVTEDIKFRNHYSKSNKKTMSLDELVTYLNID